MKYNFDEIIERKSTNSVKYDLAEELGKPADALPMWVADMDFQTPSEVIDALINVSRHGIFGYYQSKEDYFEAVHHWFNTRHGWDVKKEWLIKTPGVIFALAMAIKAYTNENDAVMIQQPVYHPFAETIKVNSRRLVNNPLVNKDGKYRMDIEDFERKIIENGVKLFVLCSPHNPVGRVWTEEELIEVGDICLKHGVIVVSDEIHADFIYDGHKHTIFAKVKPEYLDNSIICTAPSKTFNLAGLQISNTFIANKKLRDKFRNEMKKAGTGTPNTMGIVACQAAYLYGSQWLDELIKYLTGNLNFIREFLKERLPQIKLVEPQGTYLVWLDFRDLNLNGEELEDLVLNRAKLWLNSGSIFGPGGEGFQRMNIACPRSIVEEALLRLERAVKSLNN